jgi:putative hydrolase of the HAD superfamily
MAPMISAIGFDGDDTLWQSETQFHVTQARVRELLADEVPADVLDRRLLEVEKANLELYGYGAKAYTLSLIETAIDLAGSRLSIGDVQALLDAGKDLLAHPIELLPGAREAVEAAKALGLAVLLVTKGDLFHQESKVARSGFGDLVDHVEVVAEKDAATYAKVLARHGVDPAAFLMVGNSLKSDCAPVLVLGGRAAFVPHPLTWALEHPDDEDEIRASPGFTELASLAEVPTLLSNLPRDRDPKGRDVAAGSS